MCQDNTRWTTTLPLVLLDLRTTIKEDLGATCSEMLYGTTVALPGEFLHPSNQLFHDEPSAFLQHLRKAMCELSPANTSWHNKPFHYVHPSLQTCTHVFVRNDAVKPPLTPPYNGPYPVQKRTEKHFTISINGKSAVIGLDRLKPAFTDQENVGQQFRESAKPVHQERQLIPTEQAETGNEHNCPKLPITTRSGRTVGRYSYPGMVPYCMSKHAAVSFCEGLRLEMYRFGVKVITIEPWMYIVQVSHVFLKFYYRI
ncbi:hypothetical protein JTE90_005250 [Oedothorax gibbosus]|uniref:Uncharacterized protein n=1 Tax=Oedothorax gibbosus TaxID=931172 RepID=A0AAV6TT43_9ARAC|nr:hypothetical protein JTE90_005250 [Oedothorax gibbosus]